MSKTTAIVIGVDSYPQLSPPQSLCSACNDAIHWTDLLINGLKVPPEQIQLLVSPAEGASVQDRATGLGLAPANVHGAVLTDALAALDSFTTWLSAPENLAATGIIVFSGHGAQVAAPPGDLIENLVPGQRLAMAMSDAHLEGDSLAGVLMYADLDARLAEHQLRARVTVIVDACYHVIQAQQPPATMHPDASLATRLGTRLMLGTSPGSPAWQGWLGQEWRGVYSFALINLLGQWRTETTAQGVTVVLASYRELTFRARELMGVLGYDDQSPELAGAPLAPGIPFNNPSLGAVPFPAVPFPDGNRMKKEIIGDQGTLGVYTFSLTDGTSSTNIAQCLWSSMSGTITINISANNNPTISQNNELWFFNTGSVPKTQNQLVIAYQTATPTTTDPLALTFTVAANLSASANSTPSVATTWTNVTSSLGGTWYGPLSGGAWVKLIWASDDGTHLTSLTNIRLVVPRSPPSLVLQTGTFSVATPPTPALTSPLFTLQVV